MRTFEWTRTSLGFDTVWTDGWPWHNGTLGKLTVLNISTMTKWCVSIAEGRICKFLFIQHLKDLYSCPSYTLWTFHGGDMGWLEAGVQLRWHPAEGQCLRPALASLCCRGVWYWCCSCCAPPSPGSHRLVPGCSPPLAAAAARTSGPKRTVSKLWGEGSAAAKMSWLNLRTPACSPTEPSRCELERHCNLFKSYVISAIISVFNSTKKHRLFILLAKKPSVSLKNTWEEVKNNKLWSCPHTHTADPWPQF